MLKAALKNARGPVAYLVSEQIHRGIVRYGDPAIDLDAFHPVDVVAKETRVRAWLHVPGDDGRAARLAAGCVPPLASPPSGGVRIEGRDVTISNSEIAGRNIR